VFARILNAIVGRFKKLTFQSYVINRQICGDEIRFLIGDLFGAGWYGPHHDPWPELEWIKSYGICPGDVVIDCGANHGFTTVLFSRWAGENGRVYAVEPNSHNVEILRRNLELNSAKNVIVKHMAAGAEPGVVDITTHPNSTIVSERLPGHSFTTAQVHRLDDQISCPQVNFMKVDVEGFELNVLRGARRILLQRPRLALELHVFMYSDRVRQLREIFSLIDLTGYDAYIQRTVDGTIESFRYGRDTPESLSSCDLVHLFCG
jgi:FkbM family methyltransferase